MAAYVAAHPEVLYLDFEDILTEMETRAHYSSLMDTIQSLPLRHHADMAVMLEHLRGDMSSNTHDGLFHIGAHIGIRPVMKSRVGGDHELPAAQAQYIILPHVR